MTTGRIYTVKAEKEVEDMQIGEVDPSDFRGWQKPCSHDFFEHHSYVSLAGTRVVCDESRPVTIGDILDAARAILQVEGKI